MNFNYLLYKTLAAILSTTLGFGFWYMVGWFITNEQNPFSWAWYGKIVYLVFAFTSATHTMDKLTDIKQ